MNNVTFPFDANDSRKPSLTIRSIASQGPTDMEVNLLPDGPVYSLIDFAEPQMWLPVSACDEFAKAFNLTYDETTDLYIIDSKAHASLSQRNPKIRFGLGTTANPEERVNIELPYNAFDQEATFPIYPNATKYFPIRRADNDTMYTIGRTFFQEAYVIIDYDRGNFSVHQAIFPSTTAKQDIVPILTPKPSSEVQPKPRIGSYSRPAWLSNGVIAGISVGTAATLAVLGLLVFWLYRWRSIARRKVELKQSIKKIELENNSMMESDGAAYFEKDGGHCAEMEGDTCHELQHSPPASDMSDYSPNLSIIIEYYEMEDNEIVSEKEEVSVVPLGNWPPPGWI
jgi:hypothetical protein